MAEADEDEADEAESDEATRVNHWMGVGHDLRSTTLYSIVFYILYTVLYYITCSIYYIPLYHAFYIPSSTTRVIGLVTRVSLEEWGWVQAVVSQTHPHYSRETLVTSLISLVVDNII